MVFMSQKLEICTLPLEVTRSKARTLWISYIQQKYISIGYSYGHLIATKLVVIIIPKIGFITGHMDPFLIENKPSQRLQGIVGN